MKKYWLLLLILFTAPLLAAEPTDETVLLALLARNKAHVLPKYLYCLENLDYDKKLITVYINTNNNDDDTVQILENWVKKNQNTYRKIIFENHHVAGLPSTRPHEWTVERFKLLGSIRKRSMQMALDNNCAYYFVVDCDNFITPCTLASLISKDKPIIAPMLMAIPEPGDYYSNFFAAIDKRGYLKNHENYFKIFGREVIGTFKVPLVHCTVLVKSQYIKKLQYIDGSSDYDFIIFSRSARKHHIDQYICNEEDYGMLLHFYDDITLEEEVRQYQRIAPFI